MNQSKETFWPIDPGGGPQGTARPKLACSRGGADFADLSFHDSLKIVRLGRLSDFQFAGIFQNKGLTTEGKQGFSLWNSVTSVVKCEVPRRSLHSQW